MLNYQRVTGIMRTTSYNLVMSFELWVMSTSMDIHELWVVISLGWNNGLYINYKWGFVGTYN